MTRAGAAQATILCLLLFLAACGGDDPAAPAGGDSPPAPPAVDWFPATAPRVWSIHQASLFADPFHPSALYFVTWEGEIYRCQDPASDWVLCGTLPEECTYAWQRAVPSAVVPGLIYVNTDQGLLRTEDGGRSWVACGTDFLALRLLPGPAGGLLAGAGGGLHVSFDLGENWTDLGPVVDSGLATVIDVVVHPADPALMLASVHSNSWDVRGVYRSEDGGASWRKTQRNDARNLAVTPADPDRVYMGNNFTSQSFMTSDDFGETWDGFFDRVTGIGGRIAASPVDADVAVFGSGVLNVTADAGRTGTATGYGEIGDIVIFGDGSHAAFLHSGGGVLCLPLADPTGVEVLASGFPQETFAVGGPGGLEHGADGKIWGQYWSSAAYERNAADGRWRRRILPIYRPTVFAASSGTPGLLVTFGARSSSSVDRREFLVSEDGGRSWSPVPYSARVSEIHVAPWAGDELVARPYDSNSLLTGALPDGLWSPASLAQDPAVRKIVTHPQVPLVACLADSGYHAWDGGAGGWSYTGTDTLEVTDLLLAPWIEPPVLVLAGEALHYRTGDGSWQPLPDLPPLTEVAGWCLLDWPEPALFFSYRSGGEWWLGLRNATEFRRYAAEGKWIDLAADGYVIVGSGDHGQVFECGVVDLLDTARHGMQPRRR